MLTHRLAMILAAGSVLLAGAAAAHPLTPVPLSQLDGVAQDQRFGRQIASAGDVDGDGYDDLLVADFAPTLPPLGRVQLYRGSPTGFVLTPAWEARGADPDDGFGDSLLIEADVDGDGYDDVIVASSTFTNAVWHQGRVQLWRGSASGPSAAPSWTWESPTIDSGLAVTAHAGDVNRDGYDDVLILAPRDHPCCFDLPTKVYLFLGSATGLPSAPSWTTTWSCPTGVPMPAGDFLGDVDGDGFDDFALVAPTAMPPTCTGDVRQLEVYRGTPIGPSGAPQVVPTTTPTVAPAGDVNGDGFRDALCGWWDTCCDWQGRGGVEVLLGGPTGLSASPVAYISDPAPGDRCADMAGLLGRYMTFVDDADGDGDDEIALGAPWGGYQPNFLGCSSQYVGHVQVHAGAAPGPAIAWDFRVLGTTPGDPPSVGGGGFNADFGHVATAGDVNGDGQGDLVISSPGERGVGRVLLLVGQCNCPPFAPFPVTLGLSSGRSRIEIAWTDVPEVRYHAVHAGTIASLHRGVYDHAQAGCYAGTRASFPVPAADTYYLVTAAECVGVPTFGTDSRGRVRPGTVVACP